MIQQDKHFLPHVVAIPVGGTVDTGTSSNDSQRVRLMAAGDARRPRSRSTARSRRCTRRPRTCRSSSAPGCAIGWSASSRSSAASSCGTPCKAHNTCGDRPAVRSRMQLSKFLFSKGFFNNKVTDTVVLNHQGKRATVKYILYPKTPYIISTKMAANL